MERMKLERKNKNLKESLDIERRGHLQLARRVKQLEEENKKLKDDNRFLTKISKEYMEKEGIIQVTEFTQLYKDDLEKENERLKKENEELQEYKSMYEGLC